MPLTNTRALGNPLVVGRHHLFEVRIGQQPRRYIRPNRTDLRANLVPRLQRQTQTLTSPGFAAIETKKHKGIELCLSQFILSEMRSDVTCNSDVAEAAKDETTHEDST